jgi:single-stranded DNA-specific DHH superfamily exonuclease
MKVNNAQAKEFLEDIGSEDSVYILTHNDLDGFCAGILYYDFCRKKGCENIQIEFLNYGIKSLKECDFSNYKKVLISDLAPGEILEGIEGLDGKEVFYTDHHQENQNFKVPKFVLEYRTLDMGYIPSTRSVYELCGGKDFIALLGVVGDSGEKYEENIDFINRILDIHKIDLDELKNKIIARFPSLMVYFGKDYKKVFEILVSLESLKDLERYEEYIKPVSDEINFYYKDYSKNKIDYGTIVFYYFEPKFGIKRNLIGRVSNGVPEKVVIIGVPHEKKGFISLSARNQSRNYDVAELLRSCACSLPEGFGAGHLAAAGGHVRKEDLERFKENLSKCNIEEFKQDGTN